MATVATPSIHQWMIQVALRVYCTVHYSVHHAIQKGCSVFTHISTDPDPSSEQLGRTLYPLLLILKLKLGIYSYLEVKESQICASLASLGAK